MSQTTIGYAPSGIQLNLSDHSFGAAEAFYRIFRALPQKERFAIADLILRDEEVCRNFGLSEIPNEITKKAFNEPFEQMAIFETIDDLRKDLITERRIARR